MSTLTSQDITMQLKNTKNTFPLKRNNLNAISKRFKLWVIWISCALTSFIAYFGRFYDYTYFFHFQIAYCKYFVSPPLSYTNIHRRKPFISIITSFFTYFLILIISWNNYLGYATGPFGSEFGELMVDQELVQLLNSIVQLNWWLSL